MKIDRNDITKTLISLLISILMPSLQRAQELARLVQCLSNLHNLSLAASMYATEQQDFFPVHDEFLYGQAWTMYIWRGAECSEGQWTKTNYGLLYNDYLSNPEYLSCPSNRWMLVASNRSVLYSNSARSPSSDSIINRLRSNWDVPLSTASGLTDKPGSSRPLRGTYCKAKTT